MRNVLELKHSATVCQHERNLIRLQFELLKKPRPIKVTFLVTENSKWNVQSVYDALSKSSRFEVVAIVFPEQQPKPGIDNPDESEERNYSFFESRGMNVLHGYTADKGYIDLEKISPDIVFYEQPHQALPDRLWVQAVNQYALTCYVPYGILIARIEQLQFNREFHHDLWKIFCESEKHRELYQKYSDIGDVNVVVSGHPKLDAYLTEPSPYCPVWPSEKAEGQKKIIWAPHFSIKNREVAFSTFHRYYEYFLGFAQQNTNVEWVVKPHPWLRTAAVKYGLMTKEEVNRYFRRWEELPNAVLYESGDYFDLFKTSDAIILDSVSFIAEYMPTGKPMLFLVNKEPPLIGFNEFGSEIYQGVYKAYSCEDISSFISDVVMNDNDPKQAERAEIVRRLLSPHLNGAGETIREYLENTILSDIQSASSDENRKQKALGFL